MRTEITVKSISWVYTMLDDSLPGGQMTLSINGEEITVHIVNKDLRKLMSLLGSTVHCSPKAGPGESEIIDEQGDLFDSEEPIEDEPKLQKKTDEEGPEFIWSQKE